MLHRRDVADWLEHPVIVEPVNPLKRGEVDLSEAAPPTFPPDHLGLVEAPDRVCARVVVGVPQVSVSSLPAESWVLKNLS